MKPLTNPCNETNKPGATQLKEYVKFRKHQTIKTMKKIRKDMNNGLIECDNDHKEYREPLSLNSSRTLNLLLSTGGDEDGFKFFINNNNEIYKTIYYWKDWRISEFIKLTKAEQALVIDFYIIYEYI